MVKGSLVAISEGSPLSLHCAGSSFLVVVGVAHLYLLQSDTSLGMTSRSQCIVSHCGQWFLSSSGRIPLLSCGSRLGASLELQWPLILGCDGGLCRGVLSSFGIRCSSPSGWFLTLVWFLLSTCEGLL